VHVQPMARGQKLAHRLLTTLGGAIGAWATVGMRVCATEGRYRLWNDVLIRDGNLHPRGRSPVGLAPVRCGCGSGN
jgi:hypothetical protein